MKSLLIAAAVSIAVYSGPTLSHGSHGVVNESGAIEVATRTVQKMTVRDMGYTAGKLSPEWRKIDESQVTLVESGEGYYLVQVTNATDGETVQVKVLSNGTISDVVNN